MKKIGITIIILGLLGTLNAGYLMWQHYAPSGSAFCNISPTMSCDIVNKSSFAEIMGFPVSGIGIAGNIFFVVIGLLLLGKNPDSRIPFVFLIAAAGGMAFSLYLTYVEAYWLGVYCPLCLLSQAQMTVLLILAIWTAHKQWSVTHPPKPSTPPSQTPA